jgi:hypothetical protein
MTDQESSEGFLKRWSRKKINAERDTPVSGTKEVSLPDEVSRPDRQTTDEADGPALAGPKPEFDLASLPSLDSITAVTDVRAFLKPGVPTELASAALRRAWTSDPAIRDFKGLAENDWDFTDPAAMPGFGALPPGADIRKMVAQIFGGDDKPPPTNAGDAEQKDESSPPKATSTVEQIAPPSTPAEAVSSPRDKSESGPSEITSGGQQLAQSDLVQRDNDAATHNEGRPEGEGSQNRRFHGGALPK